MNTIKKSNLKELLCFLIPVIVSVAIAMVAMKVWTMDFSIIRFPDSDERTGLMLFKNIKDNGLIGSLFCNRLGAPGISTIIDIPFLDWPMVIAIWILTRFMNYNVAYYVFYFSTYATATITMYILLRKMKCNYFLSICISISFAITPYHFYRSVVHMTLSNYFVIPMGIYLILLVYEANWKFGMPECVKNSIIKRILYWLSIIIMALSNIYYAFFIMLMVLVTVVYKMIEKKTWKPIWQEAISFYSMCIIFIAGLLPKVVYGLIEGKNTLAGIRYPFETEMYGLRIIQLFLPPSYSKLDLFQRLNAAYTNKAQGINENSWSNMGLIAIIGFVITCIWFIVYYINGTKKSKENNRRKLLGIMTLLLVLYATVGGLGTIFSYVIMPELRCLNRVSIVLVALSLVFLASFLQEITSKQIKKIIYICLCCLLAFSIYAEVDYLPSGWSKTSEQKSVEYSKFFESLENSLEEGAMVYQLPHSNFPEEPAIYNMDEYALLMGYIYTDTIRWSYGGVKGRNDDSEKLYVDEGMSESFLDGIRQAGFEGLYIDGYGFEDGGNHIVEFYKSLLNENPIMSEDGRLFFFKI